MLAACQTALDAISLDASARVLVLSDLRKAFCAGHNLKEMRAKAELAYYQKLFGQCSRVMLSIQNLPVPVIAQVQGLATAAGCQLAGQTMARNLMHPAAQEGVLAFIDKRPPQWPVPTL